MMGTIATKIEHATFSRVNPTLSMKESGKMSSKLFACTSSNKMHTKNQASAAPLLFRQNHYFLAASWVVTGAVVGW